MVHICVIVADIVELVQGLGNGPAVGAQLRGGRRLHHRLR